VGYHDHAISGGDLSGDHNPTEVLPINCSLPEVVSLQAICDNDRRSGYRRDEAVLCCRLQMIDGIGSTPTIKCICIGIKRLCALGPDLLCDGSDQDRINIRVVSRLPEMDLNSGKVTFLYHFIQTSGIK